MKESKAASPPEGGGHISLSLTRGGDAYGKRTLDKAPAFRAGVGGCSNAAGLHSAHKGVLAARCAPEQLT